MPRKQREKSGTGIYHVMMRSINHQDIFENSGDYWKFLDGRGIADDISALESEIGHFVYHLYTA